MTLALEKYFFLIELVLINYHLLGDLVYLKSDFVFKQIYHFTARKTETGRNSSA